MTELDQTSTPVHIPESPAIPGLRFRHFRGPEDFAALAQIYAAAAAADNDTWVVTAETIQKQYAYLNNCDIYRDVVLAEVAGAPVAYSRVEWWDEAAGNRIYAMAGYVAPAWRRQGLGRALLKHNERRLRQIASEHASERPRFFQSAATAAAVGNAALLRREGYQAVRHGFAMVRDLAEPVGPTELPAGLEVRSPKPEQYRQVWEADAEAFRDHWGYRQPTENDYRGWLSWPHFEPSLWQVAWDGDQVAGMVQNFVNTEENAARGWRRGYTEGISVRRPWRKRGLATALINRSLAMFRELGMAEAALGVDADNPSGALRIYEGCGFRVVKQASTYRKAF